MKARLRFCKEFCLKFSSFVAKRTVEKISLTAECHIWLKSGSGQQKDAQFSFPSQMALVPAADIVNLHKMILVETQSYFERTVDVRGTYNWLRLAFR